MVTFGQDGTRASPRGDDGPVVRIHDAKTLIMPDWRGNNRIESPRNIVEDGRISLFFMVSGIKGVVRVNGLLGSKRMKPCTKAVRMVDKVKNM